MIREVWSYLVFFMIFHETYISFFIIQRTHISVISSNIAFSIFSRFLKFSQILVYFLVMRAILSYVSLISTLKACRGKRWSFYVLLFLFLVIFGFHKYFEVLNDYHNFFIIVKIFLFFGFESYSFLLFVSFLVINKSFQLHLMFLQFTKE